MSGLWIDESIMTLKRTAAEKLLLSRICYRAGIAKDEVCHDSNKDLSLAIGIHAQTVSELIQKLERDKLLTTSVDEKKANARTISPIRNFLIPYKENADRYKSKTDSDYKEIPYSTPETEPGLSVNSLDPIRNFLTPSKEIPYSLYKDIKPLEKEEENNTSLESANALSAADEKKIELPLPASDAPETTPPTPPPKTTEPVGDGRLRAECLTYNKDNPGKYTPEMYKEFLRYWTAPVLNGTKREIGKEFWETQKTWTLAGRLSTWHQNNIRDEQRNQPPGRKSSDFLNRQRAAEPAKNGYGKL